MQSCKLQRSELAMLMADSQSGRGPLSLRRQGRPEYPPSSEEIWACWSGEKGSPDEMPHLLIVADHLIEDFFAWAITFLPAYRPLTSFMRVLPWSLFNKFQETRERSKFEHQAVLVGLILGETLTNATGRGFIDSLPLTAFESTYSYAMGRSIALGFDEVIAPDISKGWQFAREFGDHRDRRLPIEFLESVWSFVRLLAKSKPARGIVDSQSELQFGLLRACEEISEQGQVALHTLERFTRGRLNPFIFMEVVKLPRERRVVLFENAAKDLMMYPSNDSESNFLVGYLASLVSDGSLEHAHLVFPLQAQFPTAMLWYAICASLAPKSNVLTDYGHLGIRLLRRLDRDENLFAAPQCDISLSELRVMMRGQPRSRTFRQTHSSILRVEIAPCVTTVIRSMGSQPAVEQPRLFDEPEKEQANVEIDRLQDLVFGLKKNLSLAETMLKKITETLPGQNSTARSKRRR